MTITYTRQYNGEEYVVPPPEWLKARIESAIPCLNPSQTFTRLVCHNVPHAIPMFGTHAPGNGGYVIDITRP